MEKITFGNWFLDVLLALAATNIFLGFYLVVWRTIRPSRKQVKLERRQKNLIGQFANAVKAEAKNIRGWHTRFALIKTPTSVRVLYRKNGAQIVSVVVNIPGGMLKVYGHTGGYQPFDLTEDGIKPAVETVKRMIRGCSGL